VATQHGIYAASRFHAPQVYRYEPENPQVFRMDPARENQYQPPPRVIYVPARYRQSWDDIDVGWDRIQADMHHRELMRKLDEGNRQLERLNRPRPSYTPSYIPDNNPGNSYLPGDYLPGTTPGYLPTRRPPKF